MESCPHHEQPREVIISVDGVAETKSSRRSLEVVSLQFSGCKEVYPCLIMRPEVDQKRNSKDAFDAYFSVFLGELEAEMIHLDKAVGDAPERANLRKQKLYGGYSSCDLCLANPENIRNERGTGSKSITFFYITRITH